MRAVTYLVFVVVMGALTTAGWPCGRDFPPYYLMFGHESLVLHLPQRVLGDARSLPIGWSAGEPWEHSLDIDLAQLRAALGNSATEELVNAYRAARTSARATYEARMASRPYLPNDASSMRETTSRGTIHAERVPGIPPEFEFYLRGTQAYYRQDYARSIARWSQILNLPESERRYRSTWAAYMIGKAYLYVDPRSAILFFEETRKLAASGYSDPLELAAASIGWQANAEDRLGNNFDAARMYGVHSDFMSQQRSIRKGLAERVIDERFFGDPFVRNHVVAILEREDFAQTDTQRIYARAAEIAPAVVAGTPGRLAHRLYRQGDFAAAAEWISLASVTDPNARWVQSKLLLREGKIDDGMRILRELVTLFPNFQVTFEDPAEEEYAERVNPICSDLGVLLLGREEFVSSLDMLARGGYFPDAAYVAECVLTPAELQAYLKANSDDPVLRERRATDRSGIAMYDHLSYVYARRLARNWEWSKAIPYYPESARTYDLGSREWKPVAVVAREIEQLLHANSSREGRVEASMKIALRLRRHGMELVGTEGHPDWAFSGGFAFHVDGAPYAPERVRNAGKLYNESVNRYWPESRWIPSSPKLGNSIYAKENEVRRYEVSRPSPQLRYHYRYRAADLMWAAAAQLPNNDPRTAQALWYGGTWLKARDPEAADRFYKALVRRCRKLPIGQQADELRWFPPMPEEWKKQEGRR